MSKQKIYNDPVYGFITIPYHIINVLIDHPYFQRLRRIKQLGLTHYVYPGALHTRFHHALGAMHLMHTTIECLRAKGVHITHDEAQGVCVAILLHDIGHSPFSHALEHSLVAGIKHEMLSQHFMLAINRQLDNLLEVAIAIFQNTYPKKFLHQLVSSQLDMDRLDYLNRDSFFTGVSEGVVNSDRIIKMLHVRNDTLVVEEKGIYSIEKFIIARRLMYWQVYLHKTVLAAENLLVNILKRARELSLQGHQLFGTPALLYFLQNNIENSHFENDTDTLAQFALLDDDDVMASIKVWATHTDKVLSHLCTNMLHRRLYKITMQKTPIDPQHIDELHTRAKKIFGNDVPLHYYIFTGSEVNNAYHAHDEQILIAYKNGVLMDVAHASDNLNIAELSKPIEKYYLCYDRLLLTED